jgi:hypothetical protein
VSPSFFDFYILKKYMKIPKSLYFFSSKDKTEQRLIGTFWKGGNKISKAMLKNLPEGESDTSYYNEFIYGDTKKVSLILNKVYKYFYYLDKAVFNFKLPYFVFFKDNYTLRVYN